MRKQSIKLAQQQISKALSRLATTETIDSGETLSGFAKKYYGNPSLWPLIALQNGFTTPQSAHLIPKGKEIQIPNKRALNPAEEKLLAEYNNQYGYSGGKKEVDQPQISFEDTSPNMQSLRYHFKLRQNPLMKEQAAQKLGLIDISNVKGFIIKHKDCNFLHPNLVSILHEVSNSPLTEYVRITEAFPATSRHTSETHFIGKAADFTISDPKQADRIARFLENKGLRVLNEYKVDTKHRTGGHIHVSL